MVGIGNEFSGSFSGSALGLESPQLSPELWGQPDMTHHQHAAVGNGLDLGTHQFAAFSLMASPRLPCAENGRRFARPRAHDLVG